MAATTINLDGNGPDRRAVVDLSGEDFTIRMRWNARVSRWVLDLSDAAGALVVAGIALVVDKPLLWWCRSDRRPQGELVVVDTEGLGSSPGFADLGTRCALTYIDGA